MYQFHEVKTETIMFNKTKDYFNRLLQMQDNQGKLFEKHVKISDKAQLASYKVAEILALKLKPQTEAETIILPTCCEIVNIAKYFPSLNTEKYDWIRNPFISSNTSEFSINEEEELISLSSDRGLKLKHSEMTVDEFWISLKQEYPLSSEKALVILLQFSTSYLCELGFSILTNIKTNKL